MSKNKTGAVMVVGGGITGMQAALDLANAIMSTWLKNPGPSAELCRNWIRPFQPMIVPCELSRPNWSRSAGTSTLN